MPPFLASIRSLFTSARNYKIPCHHHHHHHLKIQESCSSLQRVRRRLYSASTTTTQHASSTDASDDQDQAESDGDGDDGTHGSTMEPHLDPTKEHVFDPSFDNLIHGVWTRMDYEKRMGRAVAEVATLGRLFIYQYNCCPFCGKVKSVLDYYNIPYSLIEVSPITKAQLPNTSKFLHDRNVPILLAAKAQPGLKRHHIDQKVTYQSNVIIATLLDYLVLTGVMPQSEYERSRSSIVDAWLQWMDNTLIPHLYCAIDYDSFEVTDVHRLFNDGKNLKDEENSTDLMFRYLKEFKKFESFAVSTFPLQSMCGKMFHNQAKQLRLKYGIPTGYDLQYLQDALREWHEVTQMSFHGGSKPDLADITCFGILRTFHNIPLIEKTMHETGLTEWYETCEEMVGQHACVTHA